MDTLTSTKFTLPISPEYVAHWGLWEAVREIYQNSLDAQDGNNACKASMRYDGEEQSLHILTENGFLSPETLVLGKTSKRDDTTQRGKFGEGYKLALLVLARLGHNTDIVNWGERWEAKLEHDESFNSTVLNIYITSHPEVVWMQGVEFVINGVSQEQYQEIQRNTLDPSVYSGNMILDNASEKGRIYIGGLYVSTVEEFACGYAFKPGVIKLDRDRGMVDGFDLSYETSKLWTDRGGDKASELLEAEAPDVRYVEAHAQPSSALVMHHSSYFTQRHGVNAVPVSSQDEIERATKAGLKWVLVPQKVKSILKLVKSWFIPNSKSTLERLQDFKKSYGWELSRGANQDLDEIIKSLQSSEH